MVAIIRRAALHRLRPLCVASWVLILLVLAPPAAAQDSEVITGRVTAAGNQPVAGARVTATSAETGVTRSVLSDANGRFMLIFRDGGGRFELRVSFIGYAEQVIPVIRLADEDVLQVNVRLQQQAIQLDALQVRGQRPPTAGETGTTGRELSQGVLNRLPLPDFDPTTLALMAAGVVATGDSLATLGFSVGGMRDALNDVSLDGLSLISVIGALGGASPLMVPQEAIRRTQVVTSTYDVARGQFAGGQVAMTTARGTNRPQGSATWFMRDPALQSSASGSAFGNSYTQHQLSGGFGGPLVRDRLFLHGSFTLQRRSDHLMALTPSDAAVTQRVGVSADSVSRFLDVLERRYGFDLEGQTGPFDRVGSAGTLMSRLDWNISDAHSLMVTGGLNVYDQQRARIGPLELRENGGEVGNSGARGMVSMASRFGATLSNDLRFSARTSRAEQVPFVALPEGQVRVASQNEADQQVVSTLVFGGERTFPLVSSERALDVNNELSWLFRDSHRLKLGGFLSYSSFTIDRTMNRFGTFTFNSLEDLESLRPSSYTRMLDGAEVTGGGTSAALYLGDTWRPTPTLQLSYGARVEASAATSQPLFNPAVHEAFGYRTDEIPADLRISPRVGFSYRVSAPGRPLRQFRGGIGEFRARPPFEVFAAAQAQAGLANGQELLYCVGDAVPSPDWAAYRGNAASIPSSCRDGTAGRPLGARRPSVTVFDDDFGAARSVRGTLGYHWRLLGLMPISLEYGRTHGVGLAGVQDLNLDASRSFLLPVEGRPFFGVPEAISRSTGAVSSLASRQNAAFAGVHRVHSELESRNEQLTFSFMGGIPPRLLVLMNYTLARSRDQSSASLVSPSYAFAAATTAGNPNGVEWGTSSLDRRHNLTTTLATPISRWGDVALIARFVSGSPFTPMVGGDINGDGARNDRAFIFDPATSPDAEVAQGMTRLMETAPDRVRQCLQQQLARIAARNSCRNGWTQTLETRASLRPQLRTLGLDRRMTVSVNTMNMLAGIDQLVHGRDDMRGWGQPTRADATLLYPRGFDAEARRFRYVVNEQFGQTRSGRFGSGMPFQVSIQAQVLLGPQPQQLNIAAILQTLGIGLRNFRSVQPAQVVDRLFANPLMVVLEMADTLGLSDEQRTRLQATSDTLSAELAPLRDDVRARVEVVQIQELPRVFGEAQPQMDRGRGLIMQALQRLREELTPEQWRRIPVAVRDPYGTGS
jgi:hypothetical protein